MLTWLALLSVAVGRLEASPVISEFMAVNTASAEDEDGDRSDWIELSNAGDTSVDLDGWFLTDNATQLTKWRLPSVVLPPGACRLVWASGKDRDDPEGELHTNFKLSARGEFLALVEPDGVTIASGFSPAYPQQVANVSYGLRNEPSTTDWIRAGDPLTALVPEDDSLGDAWKEPTGFDDSAWTAGTSGIGYERHSGYQDLIQTDVEAAMFDRATSVYVRMPFVVEDASSISHLELRMKYDDGFVAFINGEPVADARAPAALTYASKATGTHSDAAAVKFETFTIPEGGPLLRPGTNLLAIHGLNASTTSSDFLLVAELTGYRNGLRPDLPPQFFEQPTPGSANLPGTDNPGPFISEVSHSPAWPDATDALTITARVERTFHDLVKVELVYRVMFGLTTRRIMLDDGVHGDGAPGDGVYGAFLPPAFLNPGEMIRYRVEASDAQGASSRRPLFLDPLNSPQYYGTVVRDPSVTSSIRVLHWFVQNPAAADTRSGTRCSVFYNGEFYDNVFTRTRGGSTANTDKVPKPSHKLDFNPGHHFEYDPEQRRVEEVNLNTTYTDKTYLRRVLCWDSFAASGGPGCIAFPVHVRQNNAFYGTEIFVEQMDEDYLERNHLDTKGALYKMYHAEEPAKGAYNRVEKKTRLEEDRADLTEFIEKVNLTGTALETYLFDNVDLPDIINSFAVNNLIADGDWGRKNHYLYRDTERSREWTMLPWDKDLTYGMKWQGKKWLLDDAMKSPQNTIFDVSWNPVARAVYNTPRLRAMYLRRIRSLMDLMWQPPGTPEAQLWHENRIARYLDQAGPDFLLDYNKWGNPWSFGSYPYITPAEANEFFTLEKFVIPRRSYLYAHPEIPEAQVANATIRINALEVTPDGNQDEEYIRLANPNSYSVDLSGWRLSNAVSFTFKSGTVILPGETIYVSPNRRAFRERATSPKGGERRLVVGDYQGHLSAWGETLNLLDPSGRLVDSTSWPSDPSPAQRYLRITEVMYHPRPDDSGNGFRADDFEFVELQNTGASELDITGARLSNGVGFAFTNGTTVLPPGGYVVLVKNLDAFAARYDTNGLFLAVPYAGSLANNGERVKLDDARGETILDFDFKDGWHEQTDGSGFSLTCIDPTADRSTWDDSTSWRPSTHVDGSPGTNDLDLPPGTLVINEVLAHSDTGGDWVEIKNPSGSAIDVGSWFLSDSTLEPRKYRLPAGTVIRPNDFLVVQESAFNNISDPGTIDPFALSELGDEVVLTSAEPDGTVRGFQVVRKFDASDRDVPFGLHRTSEGKSEFVAMTEPTPGAENAAPLTGPVLLSEIMYHPPEGEDEFIELYNGSASTAPLFSSLAPTHTWRLRGGIEYALPTGQELAPGEYALVVGIPPEDFRASHAIPPSLRIFGPWIGNLANEGESISLWKPGNPEPDGWVPYILVEEVDYNDRPPWPMEADGQGASLQRVSAHDFGNDPASWEGDALQPTPGRSPLVDGNADGLPDNFQWAVFDGPDAPKSGAADDHDGDGLDNRHEYIAGTSPVRADAGWSVDIEVTPPGTVFVLPTIRAKGPGYFGLNRFYAIETTTSLGSGNWVELNGAGRIAADGEIHRFVIPAGPRAQAFRAKVWLE